MGAVSAPERLNLGGVVYVCRCAVALLRSESSKLANMKDKHRAKMALHRYFKKRRKFSVKAFSAQNAPYPAIQYIAN